MQRCRVPFYVLEIHAVQRGRTCNAGFHGSRFRTRFRAQRLPFFNAACRTLAYWLGPFLLRVTRKLEGISVAREITIGQIIQDRLSSLGKTTTDESGPLPNRITGKSSNSFEMRNLPSDTFLSNNSFTRFTSASDNVQSLLFLDLLRVTVLSALQNR